MRLNMSKEIRFANYSRNFCWLLAAIWLVLGLVLVTEDSGAEILSGMLWIVGAGLFSLAACYVPRLRARSTRKPNSTDTPDAT